MRTRKTMDRQEREALYRDGFVVLPAVASETQVAAARRRIFMALGRREAPRGDEPVFLDLFNETCLFELMENALGPIQPPRGCHLATRFPAEPNDRVNEAGYRDRDTPFFGWHGHLDGLWNGAAAVHQDVDQPMTAEQLDAWQQDPSRNGCRRTHPGLGANITSFAALVAVALSDQREEGAGNVGLLQGAHHEMERFFRAQRDAGGPLGPDGPDWPRIDHNAPNRSGLRHYPDAVREACKDGTRTPDGKFWPRPTLLRLAPGDAAIILHATPHSATRVETSEPRLMGYFRITPKARPGRNRMVYPEALCDIWSEWPGMADVVADVLAKQIIKQLGPAE